MCARTAPLVLACSLLFLLLSCPPTRSSATPYRTSAYADDLVLPVLSRDVDTIHCSSDRCSIVTPGNLTRVCSQPMTLVFHDGFACFAVTTELAGYRPPDLSAHSGGEVVFCRNLLRLLRKLGYRILSTTNATVAESCVLTGRAARAEHVVFSHGQWQLLASNTTFHRSYRVRPPFREECMMSLHFYGTSVPAHLWPGDLKYYISIWPNLHNSYSLMERPSNCPAAKHHRDVPLPPYGVLFGKYKVMPVKVKHTHPFSHNGTFWRALRQKVHMVVLDCSELLAQTLEWGPDYQRDFTCWKDSPLSRNVSYHSLMMGASFFLGLGDTFHSPTPVDLIFCRTPIIMPPYQHSVIPVYAGTQEYYPVTSAQDVLEAVDAILADCRVSFTRREDGSVLKNNTCFEEPSSLDDLLSETKMVDRMKALMHSRELLCFNRTRLLGTRRSSGHAAADAVGLGG